MYYKVVLDYSVHHKQMEFSGFTFDGEIGLSIGGGLRLTKSRAYKVKRILDGYPGVRNVKVMQTDCKRREMLKQNADNAEWVNGENKFSEIVEERD